jgi:hypothetical protein
MTSTFGPATSVQPRISGQILSAANWTHKTGISTLACSPTFNPGGDPTLSTASPLCSTYTSRASTPDGATRSARTSIAYAYPTRRGGAKTITVTPLECNANPRRQIAPVRRNRYHRGPLLAQQPWYQDHQRLATATLHFPPSRDLFFPGRLGTRAGFGVSDRSLGASWPFE